MTIEEMKQRKRELGLTNADLTERTGIPIGTINKIFSGQTKSPRRENILALESVLAGSSPVKKRLYGNLVESTDTLIAAEPDAKYQAGTSPIKKRQGEYTLEDYLALPDDVRVELIDGYFYDMAAPQAFHQFIASQILYQLMGYMDKTHGPCMPVLSPIDVQLDKDDKTILQPDIIIICDPKSLVKKERIYGAPDFVAEILSSSTRRRDMTLKLAKYSNAGVRELWYIDPDNFRIMTYDLESDEKLFPVMYTFSDKVPVHIWNDDFAVDFTQVYDYIKDYLE